LQDLAADWKRIFRHELLLSDPEVEITVEPVEIPGTVYDRAAQHHLIQLINLVPNGPMRRDPEHNLVVYSNNLGILVSNDSKISLTCSPRSSVKSLLNQFVAMASQVADALNIQVKASSFYPGWEYAENSMTRDLCLKTYEDLYHARGIVNVVHAGLECGFFLEKIPELDAISMGPDMAGAHSPNEHLSIASAARTYQLLCEVLKRIR
jgi:dipeptidase D